MSAFRYNRVRRLTRNQKFAGSAILAGLLFAATHGHAAPSAFTAAASTGNGCGGSNEALANCMAAADGWTGGQTTCLDELWTRESGFSTTATNPTSGAYGIPQSLPADKMAAAGADWQTSPATQIKWGLGYIAGRYGTPCSAWDHETADNWY
jgi:resuscitation-promoting factor RpfB